MKVQMIVPQLTVRKDAMDLHTKQRVKSCEPESFTLLLQTVARNVGEVQRDHVGWERLRCWWRTWSEEEAIWTVLAAACYSRLLLWTIALHFITQGAWRYTLKAGGSDC